MKNKSILWWIVFILLAIWQLPQFMVSLVMMPYLGKKKLIADRHFNMCFVGEKMVGGISLGPFSFISRNLYSSAYRDETIAHEVDGHTYDSKILGPFYLLFIGLPSVLNAAFYFTQCYYDFFTERLANKHAGLIVTNNCRLKFKEQQ